VEHLQLPLGQLIPPVAAIWAWLIDSWNNNTSSVNSHVENEWEICDCMSGAQCYYYFSVGHLFFNWCVVNLLLCGQPLTYDRASAERLNIRDYINEDHLQLAITDCLNDAIDQAFGTKFRRGKHCLKVRAYKGSLLIKSFWCYTPCVLLFMHPCSSPLTIYLCRDKCKFVVHQLNIDLVVDITAVDNPNYSGGSHSLSEESNGELVDGLERLSTGAYICGEAQVATLCALELSK
jgi:hypothetical protein